MYPNFKGERNRLGFTLAMLADILGVTIGTLSQKLSGKYELTLSEAKKLKDAIGSDKSLEWLFATEVDNMG